MYVKTLRIKIDLILMRNNGKILSCSQTSVPNGL